MNRVRILTMRNFYAPFCICVKKEELNMAFFLLREERLYFCIEEGELYVEEYIKSYTKDGGHGEEHVMVPFSGFINGDYSRIVEEESFYKE